MPQPSISILSSKHLHIYNIVVPYGCSKRTSIVHGRLFIAVPFYRVSRTTCCFQRVSRQLQSEYGRSYKWWTFRGIKLTGMLPPSPPDAGVEMGSAPTGAAGWSRRMRAIDGVGFRMDVLEIIVEVAPKPCF